MVMTNIKEIEKVTLKTLKEARDACYKAFGENIDRGTSIEGSCLIITRKPQKRIHRFWQEALIAKIDGKIIAGLSPVPYSVRYHDKAIDMVGVGDVFCIEKGTDAIKKLFSTLYQNYKDFQISILYPFSDAYYARYGYAPALFKEQLVFKRAYLTRYLRNETTLHKAEPEDIECMNALYDEAAKAFSLTAFRSDPLDWLYNRYALNDHGYMAYWIFDKRFVIRESVGLTVDEMSAYALKILPDVEELTINAVFDQDLFSSLPEHNQHITCYRKLHDMVRIINLEKALYAIPHKGKGSIKLKVTDEMIAENNRTLLYSWDESMSKIENTDEYDIELDIKALTTLFCLGSVEQKYKGAFPLNKCACYEIF